MPGEIIVRMKTRRPMEKFVPGTGKTGINNCAAMFL
jgi:hypothetical protein